jgi:hypothetical protein
LPARLAGTTLLLLGLVLCLATPVAAAARLEVAGSVEASPDGLTLGVTVELRNAGDAPAGAVRVEGELLGAIDTASLEQPLAAGESGRTVLSFPREVPRPGVYPLLLLIEHDTALSGRVAQSAYLLVALGETTEPALALEVPRLELAAQGMLRITLRSRDGRAHTAHLRVSTPPSLRLLEAPQPVEVPPDGTVVARARLMRATAPRGSEVGIVVVASSNEGGLETTAATTGIVYVRPTRPWLPRLRIPILILAGALLLLAVALEVRQRLPPTRRESGSYP